MRQTIRKLLFNWSGLAIWVVFLVLLIYGRAVRFPFLADDSVQFPFVDAHNLSQIWGTVTGLDYYRPLAFTVWKLLGWVNGGHNQAVLHFVNLLLHVSNSLLMASLAGRLWPHESPDRMWLRRYLAASLFLTFPFSYQSVSWIAAMMHPLMTLLVLASFGSYLNFNDSNKPAWLLLSLLLTFLAPFAHEIAIVFVPLLFVYELLQPGNSLTHRRPGRAVFWLLPALAWLIVWRSVPAGHAGELLVGFWKVHPLPNVAYAAQGIAYPATRFTVRLLDLVPAGEFFVVAMISGIALAITFFIQIRRRWRLTLFLWCWLAVTLAPAILFVPFPWMSASPRVLYLASVGIAWLWADLLVGLAYWGRGRVGLRFLGPILATLAAALVLYQGAVFIRTQTQMYVLAGSAIDGLVEAASGAAGRGRDLIVINFPSWLAPPQNWYALGEEGVLVLGTYDQINKLPTLYHGQPATVSGVTYHDIRQQGTYHSGLTGPGPDWTDEAKSGSEIFVTVYTADNILVESAGVLATDPPQRKPLAGFEGLIDLLDAQATIDQETAVLTMTWQSQQELPPDVTVFVHLVDANGQLIGQIDGDSLAGTYPFWLWRVGQIVEDRRALPAGEGVAFRVGLYNRSTGQRLEARTADGQALPDDAVLVEFLPVEGGE